MEGVTYRRRSLRHHEPIALQDFVVRVNHNGAFRFAKNGERPRFPRSIAPNPAVCHQNTMMGRLAGGVTSPPLVVLKSSDQPAKRLSGVTTSWCQGIPYKT